MISSLVAAILAGACHSPFPEHDRHAEWLELEVGVVELEETDSGASELDDAPGYGISGGHDFGRSAVRVGFEFLASYSNHDVIASSLDEHAQTYRFGAGGRLTWDLFELPLSMVVRSGAMWVDREDGLDSLQASDQSAAYFSLGLRWWWSPLGAMGPFFMHVEGSEDDFEEDWFGIQVHFVPPPSYWD